MSLPAETDVAIVGAGFGGLGMAIRLKQAGRDDFVVLERAVDVGGTWWANAYPGCQCDIPSNLYSFARKSDWATAYPMREQILDYLRDCAQRFGVRPHVRLGCELLDASWDPERGRWDIETSVGRLSARVLVAAPGLLSEPCVPDLPGFERFQGTTFHTARWNHDHDLTGTPLSLLVGPRAILDATGGAADTGRAMSRQNVEIVRRSLEALQRGDETTAFEAAAPDFEGHIEPGGVGEDVFQGPQGAREYLTDFLSAWEKAELEIREVIDAGDDLVVRLRWRLRGKASGLETKTGYFAIFTLHEGKIVRYREYTSRKQALEAVGLRE